MPTTATVIKLAWIAKRLHGIPVRYIDDVGEPQDDGAYVTLKVFAEGELSEVLVLTTERFYASLGKVIAKAMPGSSGLKLS